MVCAPVWSIIHSLKLVDYLFVQARKPCSIKKLILNHRPQSIVNIDTDLANEGPSHNSRLNEKNPISIVNHIYFTLTGQDHSKNYLSPYQTSYNRDYPLKKPLDTVAVR